MNTSPRFELCWPKTLIQECPHPEDWGNSRNFSNDPNDPGGATMCGIIQVEYNKYRRQHNLPTESVRRITRDEGRDIYFNDYWLPHCPTLPAGLDLSFFDANVNSGAHSIELLQRALNLNPDRIWGPRTMVAVQALQAKPEIIVAIKNYTAARDHMYRTFRLFPNFGRDWERRTKEIGQQSLEMAQGLQNEGRDETHVAVSDLIKPIAPSLGKTPLSPSQVGHYEWLGTPSRLVWVVHEAGA